MRSPPPLPTTAEAVCTLGERKTLWFSDGKGGYAVGGWPVSKPISLVRAPCSAVPTAARPCWHQQGGAVLRRPEFVAALRRPALTAAATATTMAAAVSAVQDRDWTASRGGGRGMGTTHRRGLGGMGVRRSGVRLAHPHGPTFPAMGATAAGRPLGGELAPRRETGPRRGGAPMALPSSA